nr:TrmB family transcriptional regulator sugar-binding domain-containing protein [Natronococcus sp. AD5]
MYRRLRKRSKTERRELTSEPVIDSTARRPHHYGGFRNAVIQIALHRATGTPIEATVAGTSLGDRDLPSTLPIENAFEIQVDDERYAIGGSGAFLEDFEADSVAIRPLEE